MRTKVSRLRKVATAIVAALTLTLVSAGPAAAWNDVNPPPSSGGTGNGGDVAGGDYHCGQRIKGGIPGLLYLNQAGKYRPFWEYGYPTCVGITAGPLANTGYQEVCSSGFLVYRFYGSANNPAAAVTRSRVNLSQWCAGESGYSFPAANPVDAGQYVGSPWRATEGTNLDLYYSQHPSSSYFRNEAGQLTTAWSTPVRGSCTAVQSTATMRSWYNKAGENERIAMRAALGTDYWVVSGGGAYPTTGQAEAGISNARGYPFSWAQWTTDKTKAPAPVNAASADGYYLTSFDWEDRACASAFQFMSSKDTAEADRTVIGTCYIPLVRKRAELKLPNGSKAWKYGTLQHDGSTLGRGDGERLSLYYKDTAFTPGGPGGDTLDSQWTGLSNALQSQLITGWRNAMVADYSAWWDSGQYTASGAQVVPANAYGYQTGANKLTQSTAIDKGAALNELRAAARCRVGTTVQFDAPEPYDFPNINASADVKVTDYKVLQVSPDTVQIKLKAPTAVVCEAGGCPDGTALETLSWKASVTGTGGYKLYATDNASASIPLGYDGIVTSDKVITPDGKTRSETFTVRFLHPTQPSQMVRLTIADLQGTFTQTVKTDGLKINGQSPITGQSYTVDTGALQAQKTSNLTVTASASPLPLTATSPTSYQVDIPVVGAVQVPVSSH